MPRTVKEWIGATPDTPVPERVQLRVFQKHGGRCYRTGVRLRPGHWVCDHIIALINGGENRESNLAPIATEKRYDGKSAHDIKTAEDVKIKAKTYAMAKKAMGLGKPKSSRPIPGSKRSPWKCRLTSDGPKAERR